MPPFFVFLLAGGLAWTPANIEQRCYYAAQSPSGHDAMGSFAGGSAYTMATQIAEGYQLVNAVSLKRLNRKELGQLKFELQKILQEQRGSQPPLEDTKAVQARNRKIGRVNNAMQVLQHSLGGKK